MLALAYTERTVQIVLGNRNLHDGHKFIETLNDMDSSTSGGNSSLVHMVSDSAQNFERERQDNGHAIAKTIAWVLADTEIRHNDALQIVAKLSERKPAS